MLAVVQAVNLDALGLPFRRSWGNSGHLLKGGFACLVWALLPDLISLHMFAHCSEPISLYRSLEATIELLL